MAVSEAELKEMVKSAMAEALVEQRTLLREIIEEVVEEIALARAIDEGMKTPVVSRKEVFAALDPHENTLAIQFPQRLEDCSGQTFEVAVKRRHREY